MRETNGQWHSYAESEKIKSLTLHAYGCLLG